jgi:hypothetical protein
MEIINIIQKLKDERKNIKIYIDMDGTIVENIYDLEKSFLKRGGYIKKRPIKPIIDVINIIKDNYKEMEVNILSCAMTNDMVKEKNEWLDIHMPNINIENRIFLVNENGDFTEDTIRFVKSEYIKANLHENDIAILIDDSNTILNEAQKLLGNKVYPVHVTSLLI